MFNDSTQPATINHLLPLAPHSTASRPLLPTIRYHDLPLQKIPVRLPVSSAFVPSPAPRRRAEASLSSLCSTEFDLILHQAHLLHLFTRYLHIKHTHPASAVTFEHTVL